MVLLFQREDLNGRDGDERVCEQRFVGAESLHGFAAAVGLEGQVDGHDLIGYVTW